MLGVKGTAWLLFVLSCSACLGQERELDWKTSKPLPAELIPAITNSLKARHVYEPGDDNAIRNDMRTREVRLNHRGTKGLVVQGFCSVTGNCSFWVFEKKSGFHRLLFDDEDAVQTFEFLPHETNGYRDLMTSMHGSAWHSDLDFYHFNGTKYVLDHCAARTYRGENGEDLERPKITPQPCDDK